MKKPSIWQIGALWKLMKSDVRLFYQTLIYKSTNIGLKSSIILVFLGLIIYIFSPIDIIPDWLAFFGIVDDIALIVIVLNLLKKSIPQKLKDEINGKIIVVDQKTKS